MIGRYHPDKNACNPEASELFKEVACSYSILSDPEKRRQYDSAGFQALDVEGMDMEIDLSSLGTVNTMLVALFSKLGVPIKTTISTNVLKEALSGTVRVRPLPVGTSVSGKVNNHLNRKKAYLLSCLFGLNYLRQQVEKQSAHFFGVIINEEQAEAGIVVRVTSSVQSKFKLVYFEQEANEGYGQVLQEDSEKTGKVTSAGMYFLHFQLYKMDSMLAMPKDTKATFFKRLEGLQPCEVLQLKTGDNFFKPAVYSIEALCAKSYEDTTHKLRGIEAQIWRKRNELCQFETEYRTALSRYQEVINRYVQAKQSVDELLKRRDNIHSSFTVARSVPNASGSKPFGNGSSSISRGEDLKSKSLVEEGRSHSKGKSTKKKWFGLNLKR
ncbi:chaperone protein dnaJ 15-like isoform X2 [Olea europaea var. sylvestris]|uniref:chaperone protein dnaJ 15-like isoform X2 n=1 Tax=Olea europaea var. sylvestris TaxID=158386 RepID=UPI000C1D6186|nr:chaperone protein dnaJ 15-like isoform X2 [Olea europaea var. sylvestris]